MAIPGKIGFDPARLQVQLLNTGLQNKDQQLYQLLFLMISAMEKLKDVANITTGAIHSLPETKSIGMGGFIGLLDSLYDGSSSNDGDVMMIGGTGTGKGEFVPYHIFPTETFTVPIYKQALFDMPIECEGLLQVDGYLIDVSLGESTGGGGGDIITINDNKFIGMLDSLSESNTGDSLVMINNGIISPHHVTHETGGTDVITSISGAIITSGTIADARLSTNVQLKPVTESDVTNLVTDLSNKAPLIHHINHESGGTDPLDVKNLAGYPGGTTSFLRADATFQTVTGTGSSTTEQTTALTGTQNNFSLTSGNNTLRCTNTAPLEFTGFTNAGNPPTSGDRFTVLNLGTSTVRISHQDTNSSANNRCIFTCLRGQILGVNGGAEFIYDGVNSRWLMKNLNPGKAIKIPFAATDFVAITLGGWAVDAADVLNESYIQYGSEVRLFLTVNTSSIVDSGTNFVAFRLPNGFTGANGGNQISPYGRYSDNFNSTFAPAVAGINPPSGTTIVLIIAMTGTFATGTNNFLCQGIMTLIVD